MTSRMSWNRSLTLAVLVGMFVGIGLFTLGYADGTSYLSSRPEACANCHVMNDEYAGWGRASHHQAARCVDCHLPHALPQKLLAKAENGYHHSKGFTLENFHEPILIQQRNSAILERQCRACHTDMVTNIVTDDTNPQTAVSCTRCHAGVGHGFVN